MSKPHATSDLRAFATVILGALVIAVGLTTMIRSRGNGSDFAAGTTTAPSSTTSPAPTGSILPSDKQARLDYMASLQALASAAPSKDPDAGRATLPPGESPFSTYAQVAAGDGFIVQSNLGPPGQRDAMFTNDWYEMTDDGITEVYAGGSASSPEIGLLDVVSWRGDHEEIIHAGTYETPTNHGALTIIGASGDVLNVQATDGTTFEFSVETLSFG